MCSDRRKNHGCGQKKTKSTSSAIFGVETAAKSCELKRCADRVRNRTDKRVPYTFYVKRDFRFHLFVIREFPILKSFHVHVIAIFDLYT